MLFMFAECYHYSTIQEVHLQVIQSLIREKVVHLTVLNWHYGDVTARISCRQELYRIHFFQHRNTEGEKREPFIIKTHTDQMKCNHKCCFGQTESCKLIVKNPQEVHFSTCFTGVGIIHNQKQENISVPQKAKKDIPRTIRNWQFRDDDTSILAGKRNQKRSIPENPRHMKHSFLNHAYKIHGSQSFG